MDVRAVVPAYADSPIPIASGLNPIEYLPLQKGDRLLDPQFMPQGQVRGHQRDHYADLVAALSFGDAY